MLVMVAMGGRWRSAPASDPLPRLMARARSRRRLLDWSRRLTAYLEVRWSQAARDLRDHLDQQRAGR